MGCHFPSRLTATLNLCLICFKITRAPAILLEHMYKKFEIDRTKFKGGCQSGRKVVLYDSKSDLPLRMDKKIPQLWEIFFSTTNSTLHCATLVVNVINGRVPAHLVVLWCSLLYMCIQHSVSKRRTRREESLTDLSFRSCIQLEVHRGDKKNGILAPFSHKMAFLKSKFKDDPVRVQWHNVPHFKGLEQTFKMRYSTSLNSHWIQKYQPSKLNVRIKTSGLLLKRTFFLMFNFDGLYLYIQ